MLRNPYAEFLSLLPGSPLQAGVVLSAAGGEVTVQLPGGAQIVVRGAATAGQTVYVRDGVVEGTAAALPLVLIEV